MKLPKWEYKFPTLKFRDFGSFAGVESHLVGILKVNADFPPLQKREILDPFRLKEEV